MKTEEILPKPQKQITEQMKNDSTLKIVANSIIKGFDNLYGHLQKMKQKAFDRRQVEQLSHMEDKIDILAEKTLSQSQDLRNTMKRNNVEEEIQNLKRQLQLMQKKHEQLAQRQDDLEKRVEDLECNMVTRQQFQQLRNSCQERFSLFDNRFKVMQDQNQKLYIYADEQFKRRIKPSEQFKQKLSQLMNTNYRLFEYAKKLYWSIINQILAYRALSTGMVQKGSIKAKYHQMTLFKQVVNVVNTATYIIAGIPFVSSIFMIVKDLATLFFNKKQQAVIQSMKIRVQGYFTQDEIAEDVARAVLQLVNNPYIEIRLAQFRTKSMIISALCKFFQFVANNQDITPEKLAQLFFDRLSKIKKQKQSEQSKYLNENVITDTSLIMWKMAETAPAQKRYAISGAARSIFKKPQQIQYCHSPQFNQPPTNSMQANCYGNIIANTNANMGISMNMNINNYALNNVKQSNVSQNSSSTNGSRNFLMDSAQFVANDINRLNQNQVLTPNNGLVDYHGAFQQYSNPQNNPINNVTSLENKNMVENKQNLMQPPSLNTGNYPKAYNSQRPPYFKLKIFKADLSLKKQIFGKMNPYVMAKYGPKLVRTQPCRGGDLDPVWNQEFIFETEQMPSAITIEVYDKERLMKDDLLGTGTILDTQIDMRQQQIQLWNQGKAVGKIFICLQP